MGDNVKSEHAVTVTSVKENKTLYVKQIMTYSLSLWKGISE